jgi:hypothetical protein
MIASRVIEGVFGIYDICDPLIKLLRLLHNLREIKYASELFLQVVPMYFADLFDSFV